MGLHKFMIDKFCGLLTKMDGSRMAGQAPYTGLTEYKDIPYSDDGMDIHTLDVYRPEKVEGKLPVIVDVHGGAWIYGRKEINKQFCHAMALMGFVVVNLNYRTIRVEDGGTFPNILADVFMGYNWVEEHIEEYGGDLNNVFLVGDSAGAHISGFSLVINASEELSKELNMHTDLKFRSLGWVCGVSDVEAFRKRHMPMLNYIFSLFFGKEWKKSKYLSVATMRNNEIEKAFPPTFLNSAYADFMRSDVLAFDKLLEERGIEHELYYIDENRAKEYGTEHKLDHCFNVHYPEWKEGADTNEAMIAFFRKHMAE